MSSLDVLPQMIPIDLSNTQKRLKKKLDLNEDTIKELVDEYKKFLFLAKVFPKAKLVPGPLVDEVWHDHILHTKQYADDCNLLFGSFMHHTPSTNEMGEDIGETLKLYQETFHMNPPCVYWNTCNNDGYCTKCCGNVCSKQCKNCRRD
jgi:hypothetical protein